MLLFSTSSNSVSGCKGPLLAVTFYSIVHFCRTPRLHDLKIQAVIKPPIRVRPVLATQTYAPTARFDKRGFEYTTPACNTTYHRGHPVPPPVEKIVTWKGYFDFIKLALLIARSMLQRRELQLVAIRPFGRSTGGEALLAACHGKFLDIVPVVFVVPTRICTIQKTAFHGSAEAC
jgi:hypothetical protein